MSHDLHFPPSGDLRKLLETCLILLISTSKRKKNRSQSQSQSWLINGNNGSSLGQFGYIGIINARTKSPLGPNALWKEIGFDYIQFDLWNTMASVGPRFCQLKIWNSTISISTRRNGRTKRWGKLVLLLCLFHYVFFSILSKILVSNHRILEFHLVMNRL